MRRHPIIFGLVLMMGIGVLFFLFVYGLSSLSGDEKIISLNDKIGVVEIKGVINASKDIVDQLEEYDDDDDIKAIVLRIDSPGGAVVPSQEIYDKVLKVREKKKIAVSMGSVAASGGYYIACAADRIVANPGTITGSIGVVVQIPQIKELLKKIGLQSTVIKRGKYKDVGSPTRDMTPDEKMLMQAVVDDIYEQFVEAVSVNRNIAMEKIKDIADGRIFTGRQALSLGLVDELGDMEDTLDIAAQLSGIEGEPQVVYPKKKRKPLLRYIINEVISSVSKQIRGEKTGIHYVYIE